MTTQIAETREFHYPPPDSVDSKQTLDGFSPNSKTLGNQVDQTESNPDDESNYDYLSPLRDGALDDQSDSEDVFLDVESQEEEEEKDLLPYSPVNSVPVYSHWSSTPWDSQGVSKASALGWPDWPKPLSSNLSDTKSSESLIEETEAKPSVLVSPAWSGEIKSAMVGAGLANLGNTCFLNAILQCFTHTVPLVHGLMSYDHPRPCDRDREGFCVLCALCSLIEHSVASMGRVLFPWKIVNNLSYISSDFRRFQQEDAHEFLQCLLDRLDSCLYLQTKDMTLSSVDENLVKQVFGGRLISKLQCCNCGHCSDTYEPLIDLSLEIENVDTLSSALESFTKVERIEDPETKFTCEKCKEEVSVEKQLILDQAPSVAAFHLKRFKNDGSYVEKIDKHVEFPLELDLLPYTGGSQNNNVALKYDLYAIVVHIGFSSTSGHYYCFVRSAPDAWYRLDDSKVTRVQEDFVLSQEAYILFYAKQGTPWFSSFMETEKSSIDPNISNNSPKSVLDNMDHISTPPLDVANDRRFEVNEARDNAVQVSVGSSNRHNHDGAENEVKDESYRLSTPVLGGTSSSSSGMLSKVEKKFSPSVLRDSNLDQKIDAVNVENKFSPSVLTDNNLDQKFNAVKNGANIIPPTPPRSPSPDIYAEEPPVVTTYSIPRDHLASGKQVPCKRQLEKDLDDSERREARKLLKHMPKGRGSKLLAAMSGSQGEGSQNRRSKRIESSLNRNDSPSSARHKPNLSSSMRAVAAGSFR